MTNLILQKVMRLKCRCFLDRYNLEHGTKYTPSEFKGLQCLISNEGMSALEFADKIGLSPSRSSRIIDKMMDEGLVETVRSKHDRRKVELYVTEKGAESEKEVALISQDLVQKIEEKYGPEKVQTISESLDILLDIIN